MINPQIYINEAKKLENSKSVFEYLMKDITSSRYEKIAELYCKAGNIYKISDKEKAIKCFKCALHYNSQLYNIHTDTYYELNKKDILLNIAQLYSKFNYSKAIEYYEQIINYYTEKGDIFNIIKYYEIIGDLYFDNNCMEESKQIYNKTINLINSNLSDMHIIKKKKLLEKICEILINSANLNNSNSSNLYGEISKHYFELTDLHIKNKILFFQTKKYILLGLLADCASDDLVKAKINFDKYSILDYTFCSSNEGLFVKRLFDAIEQNDSDMVSELCVNLNKIIILDNMQIGLLSKIKNLIEEQIVNDEQIDLS